MSLLRFREKVGYSCGEIGGSGLNVILGNFLAAFYTDTYGLEAAAVGTLFLVARIIDAVVDPGIGMLADRTRTRWGRYRPYLIWMAPLFGLGVLAMFFGPQFAPGGKLLYAYLTYNLMMVIYSFIMVPFAALSGEITQTAEDRNSLNSIRFFVAFAVNLVLQATLKPAVKFFGEGDDSAGFRWALGIFVCLALPGFLIAFGSTRERPRHPSQQQSQPVLTDLRDLLRSRAWLTLLAVCVVLWGFFAIRSGVRVYYFKYFMNDDAGVSNFLATGTLFTLVGVLLTPALTRRFEKAKLFICSLLLTAGFSIAHYWVDPGEIVRLYCLQIMVCLVGGPLMPLIWSMMADAADEFEAVRGRSAMGLVYSASTLALKGGEAVGAAFILYLLAWNGFKANVEQNEEVLGQLRNMLSFYPAIGFVLAALLLLLYPLTRARMQEVERTLAERREAQTSAG
ncbi:MAG: glycoside-pentoside-hexuronide (GPH):cation symporter [Opitutaceae bacterium]|nr:glycoside-pentoside-hexuronide (GPH):cation symporter [Opitutaceae bacterium]